jgi:hypothetical protein
MSDAIRWTIKVSKETDLSLRTFLGSQGMKKGDISKFVEDAVQWQLLARNAEVLKERNKDHAGDALEGVIEDEVRAVRTAAGQAN